MSRQALAEAESRIERAVQDRSLALELDGLGLETLPESIGQLQSLQELYLQDNQLTSFPESVGQLQNLQTLYLYNNQLASLPESVCQLQNLQTLYLHNNQLTSLPESVGQLQNLHTLDLDDNQLTSLPESFGQLQNLQALYLRRNPLSPLLAAAAEQGSKALIGLLRERKRNAVRRFEAKLLILGDGNEGKTCVSRAIRGLPFADQKTTRGVDVEQWSFAHPEEEQEITLNLWDFEGQEINHQTHQFFLTSDAIYLVVFKCREQFQMERAEYWLDTIEARAPGAKVAIVITECEERRPFLPEDQLESEYPGTLHNPQWLFPVGCSSNVGVPELQQALKTWATELPHMGEPWTTSHVQAEEKIEQAAESGTQHVTRQELYQLFSDAGVNPEKHDGVAYALGRLGILTQFPHCTYLKDFIVLEPQWLTKAISLVLENPELNKHKGQIGFAEMEQIWEAGGHDGMFLTFHNCMKEFELCYDREDHAEECLVPLRFGYKRPRIPWSQIPNAKIRRVQYKLNKRTPMGLMSRFIVKTHYMIAKDAEYPLGVYWHNGVFLRTGSGELLSEALCEFDPHERTLSIEVRAAFPQGMVEQIHGFAKAVFSFFKGLTPTRSFGCIQVSEDGAENQCPNWHSEQRIYYALTKERPLDCETKWHDVPPQRLISGIGSFGSGMKLADSKLNFQMALRRELDKTPEWAEPLVRDLRGLVKWAGKNSRLLHELREQQVQLSAEQTQELQLRLREYLGFISDMLDDRIATSAPAIFSIGTEDQSKWNINNLVRETYFLTPYCECENNIHRHEAGQVKFQQNKEWWDTAGPWVAGGTKILQVGLQLAFAGMPLAMGPDYDLIKNEVSFMKELTKHLELDSEVRGAGHVDESKLSKGEIFADEDFPLRRFLEKVAPDQFKAKSWGELERKHFRGDNTYRWLCKACRENIDR